jgi:hypothetical protein
MIFPCSVILYLKCQLLLKQDNNIVFDIYSTWRVVRGAVLTYDKKIFSLCKMIQDGKEASECGDHGLF